MTNRFIKSITIPVAALTLLAGGVGCNKLEDFGKTNVNPAATTTPITSALLTNALSTIGNLASDTRAGIFVQYFAEPDYPNISLYTVTKQEFGSYSGALYDLQNIINISTNNAEKAAARITKAYIFWTITDRWGDIPYFGALKGVAAPYDKQEDIYKDLLKELTEANAQLDQGGFIAGDIHYGNDIAKWKKLSNSLRMLMALRLSKRYPATADYAATQFRAGLAGSGGSIETNADNFSVKYPGGAFRNPFFVTHLAARDYGESQQMVSLLASLGDTRQNAYGTSTTGVPYGLKEVDINAWRAANPNWSRHFSDAVRGETSPIVVVGASAVLLARAEAADRGWTTENATTVYNAGITQSFAQWGVTLPATYLTQASVALTAPTGTAANIQKIATQRYLAYYGDGIQGWSVWRKTGFPVLVKTPNPVSSAHVEIPRRYVYGESEFTLNSAGVNAAVARLSAGDTYESRIWWDQ
ncbi:MAG: SusD/RagB family nutrient-binding outer rane lipoprotein [Ferruginibacter sp.]|nr:SusD/RagB family nutrient-binding outer rane lipoprotein [Ferruginibacter sp.]